MIRNSPKESDPREAAVPVYRCQRLLDTAVALPALLPALPVMVFAGVLIRITSRGPAFYSQWRSGRGGRPFRIFKLRTMYHNCEAESGACWSSAGDPRITRVGRWLRRFHVDELPQLFNVLRGEMSIVGPRPERPEIIADLAASIPHYQERLIVRPGVTGLAQIQQPADITPDCVRRKLHYDRHYIQNRSLTADLRILFGTVLYLMGCSFEHVRAWAGLSVPALPDDIISLRVPVTATFRETLRDSLREPSVPALDAPPGVTG